jgi:hypothetical protein
VSKGGPQEISEKFKVDRATRNVLKIVKTHFPDQNNHFRLIKTPGEIGQLGDKYYVIRSGRNGKHPPDFPYL